MRDELKAEYLLLQAQYEAFDGRALSIKALGAPLLGGGVGVGLQQHSIPLIAAVIVVTASLWTLEAIWKSFQYCLTDRILLLEKCFRGESPDDIAPFQIFASWGQVYHRHYKKPASLLPLLRQPFVFLPYLPIGLFGLAAIVIVAMTAAN